MSRRHKRIVHRTGDVCVEDYGGGALVRYGAHMYLEHTFGAETDAPYWDRYRCDRCEEPSLTVYRVSVPRGGRGKLCDVDAIRRDLDWVDWLGAARCVGMDPWDVLAIALDPARAWALYEIAAEYHGWSELDPYPEEIPYRQVTRRWRGKEHGR